MCDLGLTHINNGNRTINSGFVGNLDYHAPEQKQRGFHEVGTYTDIYSLGLIINVMFTKEIPIGENYKKIWECAPYFHFIDEIINRMVQHDYSKRENDINSVLMELNEHNMEFEVEESFLKIRCSKLGIHPDKVKEVMNLYALSTYFLKNGCNLSVNNNYYCDYHFRCNDKMLNYLLLCILHKKIRNRFETEISEYSQSLCINLNSNEDMLLFESLKNAIDLDTYEEAACLKANIQKYFQCIYEYHAKEFLDSICKVKNEINYYCLDAPILAITFYVKENAYELGKLLREKVINKKITLSGGEPLMQKDAVLDIIKKLPDFDIALYTGHELNEVPNEILQNVNYVKTGPFVEKLKSSVTPFVGSTNQTFMRVNRAKM